MDGPAAEDRKAPSAPRITRPILAPPPTTLGRSLLGLTILLAVLCVLAAGVTGPGPDARPPGLMSASTWMGLAIVDSLAFLIFTLGWRLPGVRRLYPSPSPLAIASERGLELHIPSVGVRVYRWEDVGSLARGEKGGGILRAPGGEELVSVPACLMSGNRRTLAESVVEVCGDKYVAQRSWRFGPRKHFALRTAIVSTNRR